MTATATSTPTTATAIIRATTGSTGTAVSHGWRAGPASGRSDERIELGIGAGAQGPARRASAPRPAAGPRRPPDAGARPRLTIRVGGPQLRVPGHPTSSAAPPGRLERCHYGSGLADHAAIITGGRGASARRPRSPSPPRAPRSCSSARSRRPRWPAGECRAAGGRAEFAGPRRHATDAGERALDACLQAFGRIDVLVNSAGRAACGPSRRSPTTSGKRSGMHVMAPMRLMRAVAPPWRARRGRIVNVCSSSGKRPSLTNAAYSVTKAAELSLSRAYAEAYAAKVCSSTPSPPGPVAGELWLGPGGLADQTRRPGRQPRRGARINGRPGSARALGTEAEIAAVIVFLCSSRPPTSSVPRGRSTAAPCRSSSETLPP